MPSDRLGEPLNLVPQTSQKSLLTESWPCGHTVPIPAPLDRRFLYVHPEQDMCLVRVLPGVSLAVT